MSLSCFRPGELSLQSVTGRDLVAELSAVPRRLPPPIREEIISLLAGELIEGKTVRITDSKKFIWRYGIFYPIFIYLHHTDLWYSLRELATDSPDAAVPIARLFITKILDLIDQFPVSGESGRRDLDSLMEDLFAEYYRRSMDGLTQPEEPIPIPRSHILSGLFARLIPLLAQIPFERIHHPVIRENTRKACLDAQKKIEAALSGDTGNEPFLDEDEIQELIDHLQEAMKDLAGDLPGPVGEDAKHAVPAKGLQPEDSDSGQGSDTSGDSGTGGGSGDGSGDISSVMQQAITLLQDLEEESGHSPADFRSGTETNLLNDLLQQTVLHPVSSELRSLNAYRNSIRFLGEILPGKESRDAITVLKQDTTGSIERIAAGVEHNPDLKRIIRGIGRTRIDYGVRSSPLSPMGRSEMYSITRSRDITRLLPAETILLRHPVLKKKFYADFTEGKLLTYHLQGRNWAGGRPKKKKGPVVALVDTSGSMQGFPEFIAKSIILATSKIMRMQERSVKVVLFSGPGNTHEIELHFQRKLPAEFLSFLQTTFGGGTDFNTALKSGLTSVREPEFIGADLLFITDGISELSNREVLSSWKKFKRKQESRVYAFIIGSTDEGGLSEISDYTYFIQPDPGWEESGNPLIRIMPSPENPPHE